MPNWCENSLIVSGESLPELVDFIKECRGIYPSYSDEQLEGNSDESEASNLCFNQFVPIPEEVLSQGYSDAGYNFQIENWGTKWGVTDVGMGDIFGVSDNSQYYIEYSFDTAWSPPIPWVIAASKLFPGLTFSLRWKEYGAAFKGELTVYRGEEIAGYHTEMTLADCIDGNIVDISQTLSLEEAEALCGNELNTQGGDING